MRARERAFPFQKVAVPWKGLVTGTAGGVAGALAMSFVLAGLRSALPGEVLPAEESSRPAVRELAVQLRQGGQTARESPTGVAPTVRVAARISSVLGCGLSSAGREAGGTLMHLGFGAGTGMLYGAAAELFPSVTRGAGLPFGLSVWLGADEAVLPLLGLSRPPGRIGPAVHVGALVAHLVFGATTEFVRRTLRRRL